MKNLSKSLAAALALFVGLSTERSHADDHKTYPASACVPQLSGVTSLNGIGQLTSSASGLVRVFCPVINDKESTNRVLTTAAVYVGDQNPNSDASCRVFEHIDNWTGWGPMVYTSGFSSTPQRLESTLGGNTNIALAILCWLPATFGTLNSYIDRYTVTETN